MIRKLINIVFPHTYRTGIIIGATFFAIGVGLIGIYASAVDYTNSTAFCAFQCHEMQRPYSEYMTTKHYKNEFGVRAECPDCHVSHQRWQFTMYAKALATNDLFEHFFGHYASAADVDAQFEADRAAMAKRVWARMKESDSRECRNCHSYEGMELGEQMKVAQRQHSTAVEKGKTCIDCHKGLVHKSVNELLESTP